MAVVQKSQKAEKPEPHLKARIPADLMKGINDYRFARQMETKTEAVVELLRRGLEAHASDQNGSDLNSGSPEAQNSGGDAPTSGGVSA